MLSILSILIVFQSIIHCSISQPGIRQQYSPCTANTLIVERVQNGPPGKRNTWNGIIYLNRVEHDPGNAEIILKLDNPGKMKLKDKSATVSSINGGYRISYLNAPSQIEFTIQANPNSAFPNPVGLYLNGQDICQHKDGIIDQVFSSPPPTRPVYTTTTSGELIGEKFNPDQNDKNCGRRQIKHQGLITNGYPSQEGEWPWHAAIYHRKDSTSVKYSCGGTLITSDTVLTAGHCTLESGRVLVPSRITVKLGQHNRLLGGKNTEEFQVYNIIPHDDFDSTLFKNDIAVLKLATRVVFNYFIQPVCLWPKQQAALETVVNRMGIVVGWGINEENELADILTQGRMPVVDLLTCLESNRDFFGNFLSNTNFCAGYRNGTSVCNGDSGGGMYFADNQIYYLRGIVSIAVAKDNEAVCNPKQYVIFTDVAKYIDWINKYL